MLQSILSLMLVTVLSVLIARIQLPVSFQVPVSSVSNGDRLYVNNLKGQALTVQIIWIDAQELAQQPYRTTTQWLKQLLPQNKGTRLRGIDLDQYGRTVGKVSAGKIVMTSPTTNYLNCVITQLLTLFRICFPCQQHNVLKNCYVSPDLHLDLLYSLQEISHSIRQRATNKFSHSQGTGGYQMT